MAAEQDREENPHSNEGITVLIFNSGSGHIRVRSELCPLLAGRDSRTVGSTGNVAGHRSASRRSSGGALDILEEKEGPWQIILTTFAEPQNFVGGHCQGNVVEFADNILGMQRTGLSWQRCEAHLGHVFDEGPRPPARAIP